MRHDSGVPARALFAAGLFLLGGTAAHRAVPAGERGASRRAPADEDPGAPARATRLDAQKELVARLETVAEEEADFFAQLELSIARQTFADMEAGAAAMLNENGGVITRDLDWFHNQLDEFQRALVQLESGNLPARETYGRAANEEARRIKKPLKLPEIQRRSKAVARELHALEELANEAPGLEELDLDCKLDSVPELVEFVHRIDARIQVLTDRRMGMGPKFTTAQTDVAPLHGYLLKLVQEANGLDGEGLTRKSEAVATFE